MTVVNRRTFIAKRGHVNEVVDMISNEDAEAPERVRIYVSHYGRFDTVAMELEFSSVDEMEQAWTRWYASDHGKEFLERWHAITETGGTNEVWMLK